MYWNKDSWDEPPTKEEWYSAFKRDDYWLTDMEIHFFQDAYNKLVCVWYCNDPQHCATPASKGDSRDTNREMVHLVHNDDHFDSLLLLKDDTFDGKFQYHTSLIFSLYTHSLSPLLPSSLAQLKWKRKFFSLGTSEGRTRS